MPQPVSDGNPTTVRVFVGDEANDEGRADNYIDVTIAAADTAGTTTGAAEISFSNATGLQAGSSGAAIPITLI